MPDQISTNMYTPCIRTRWIHVFILSSKRVTLVLHCLWECYTHCLWVWYTASECVTLVLHCLRVCYTCVTLPPSVSHLCYTASECVTHVTLPPNVLHSSSVGINSILHWAYSDLSDIAFSCYVCTICLTLTTHPDVTITISSTFDRIIHPVMECKLCLVCPSYYTNTHRALRVMHCHTNYFCNVSIRLHKYKKLLLVITLICVVPYSQDKQIHIF